MTGREPAGEVDRDITGTLDLIADAIGYAAEVSDYRDAGGAAARRVLHDLIDECRRIEAAIRGRAVTP